ncbi:bacteriocin-like protein [Orenia metallireducens]|uniref:Bacteriocin-type signal sequence-containing protein n=1 Tax=Orenia metallireducens TaxID=1413210 RepID=A0A285IFZ5_9FIRM|nr:hypothetical protein [Orenia metallireducens]PRX18133.1 bacteriocin-like protein [Orenia metallireducens]SNY46895.1 bacteriocin-type signal sequence-containing protein [Orenia metallireducens]
MVKNKRKELSLKELEEITGGYGKQEDLAKLPISGDFPHALSGRIMMPVSIIQKELSEKKNLSSKVK